VLLRIDNVKEAILGVDRQADRVLQSLGDLAFHFALGIEDQNPVQLAVRDKEAVVVVDGQPIDPAKVGLVAVADELGFVGLGIEDEDGANFLIGDIHQSLGIDGNAVGANQLVGKRLGIDLFFVGLASG